MFYLTTTIPNMGKLPPARAGMLINTPKVEIILLIHDVITHQPPPTSSRVAKPLGIQQRGIEEELIELPQLIYDPINRMVHSN